nr:uncharacterized protein LOC109183154 [Ipomoea trifida]
MHHGNVWSRGPIKRPRYPTSPVDKFAKESTDKESRRSPKGAAPRLPAKSPITTPLTSLKARPSEILVYAEECQLVKPANQGYIVVPDQEKYCRYHRRYGHSTDECQAWRKEIEALLQPGQLGNYIDWNRMHYGNVWRRGPIERPRYPVSPEDQFSKESTDKGKRLVINVIFGRRSPSAHPSSADWFVATAIVASWFSTQLGRTDGDNVAKRRGRAEKAALGSPGYIAASFFPFR